MSKIEWTGRTFEVSGGCTECSPGCRGCYARQLIWRFAHNPVMGDKYKGLVKKVGGKLRWTGKIKFFPEHFADILKRQKSTTYFVDSRSDLFHPSVPFEWVDKVFAVMALCPQHTFQVLTKQGGRMAEYLDNYLLRVKYMQDAAGEMKLPHNDFMYTPEKTGVYKFTVPLPNVWLGVTVENQELADKRIPILLQIPAALRFLSVEPMLGPVDLKPYVNLRQKCIGPKGCGYTGPSYEFDSLKKKGAFACPKCKKNHSYLITDSLDWVICGGESGPGARPMHPDWARGLRDQCKAAGVPFFFKQWGAWKPESCDRKDRRRYANHPRWHIWGNGTEVMSPVSLRVGKKKAGCLLDGIEHKEYPEAL